MPNNTQAREQMIQILQRSLRQIRVNLNYGAQEFADILGMTRQSLHNLEQEKNRLSVVQHIALCAVIDQILLQHPQQGPLIMAILSSRDPEQGFFLPNQSTPLLERWFALDTIPEDDTSLPYYIGKAELDTLGEYYYLFFDDTLWYEEEILDTLSYLLDILEGAKKKIILPMKVVEHFYEERDKVDPEIKLSATNALQRLTDLQQRNLLDIRGEQGDIDISSVLLSVFAKFKSSAPLALFTQNPKLANQIQCLNDGSVEGKAIILVNYDQSKGFHQWFKDEPNSSQEATSDLAELPLDMGKQDIQPWGNLSPTQESPPSLTEWGTL